MTRRLLFVTGTRADFGKLAPLAAAARDAGHDVGFFVTGMHMIARYGLTVRDVQDVLLLRLEERYAEYLQVGFIAFARMDGKLVDAGTHPIKYYQNSAT